MTATTSSNNTTAETNISVYTSGMDQIPGMKLVRNLGIVSSDGYDFTKHDEKTEVKSALDNMREIVRKQFGDSANAVINVQGHVYDKKGANSENVLVGDAVFLEPLEPGQA